jgi:hypothetical protein
MHNECLYDRQNTVANAYFEKYIKMEKYSEDFNFASNLKKTGRVGEPLLICSTVYVE